MPEFLPVRGLVDGEHRRGGRARTQSRPIEREPIVLLGRARFRILRIRPGRRIEYLSVGAVEFGHQRTVAGGADGDLTRVLTRDLDRLLADLQRFVAVVVDDLPVADLLHHEVSDIGAEVRQTPRDGLIVSDDDTRQSGEGEPGDVEGALFGDLLAPQTHLVPDRGHRRGKVRIIGQQRSPGARVLPGDHPRVRPDIVTVLSQHRRQR